MYIYTLYLFTVLLSVVSFNPSFAEDVAKDESKIWQIEPITGRMIKEDGIKIIYFTADWCAPCKKIKDELAEEGINLDQAKNIGTISFLSSDQYVYKLPGLKFNVKGPNGETLNVEFYVADRSKDDYEDDPPFDETDGNWFVGSIVDYGGRMIYGQPTAIVIIDGIPWSSKVLIGTSSIKQLLREAISRSKMAKERQN